MQRMYNFKAFFAVLKSVKEVRRLERWDSLSTSLLERLGECGSGEIRDKGSRRNHAREHARAELTCSPDPVPSPLGAQGDYLSQPPFQTDVAP